MPDTEYTERMRKELLDRGKFIEAGWVRMRALTIPVSAPALQVDAMRTAFYMGAYHLYVSLEDAGDNAHYVEMMVDEMNEFMREFKLKYTPPEGSA